ncbi:hypothetical protein Efla_007272 [Eimeria flavescens]
MSWEEEEKAVPYGPFLPGSEEEQLAAAAAAAGGPPVAPLPPLLYPRGVCTAAWDKARLQLGLLLSRAAADVRASPSTAAAAVAAFHGALCSFTHLDSAAVSSCLCACLFLAGKAADEEFNLRSVVASLGFCKHHAQQQRQQQQQQQRLLLQQQQQQQYVPLEALLAAALLADAAAGPLAAEEGEETVVAAAACIVAHKLARRLKVKIKQQQEEAQQRQLLYSPSVAAAAGIAATPDLKWASTETMQLLEDELTAGLAAANAAANPAAAEQTDTARVLQRLLPLLESSSSSRKETPLCQRLAAATKKMLLQYALLLDDSRTHAVYTQLAARGVS